MCSCEDSTGGLPQWVIGRPLLCQTRVVPSLDARPIREAAAAAGADSVGITSAAPLDQARSTLESRKRRGMGGPLHFTYDRPDVAADVRRTFPWANSLVVIGCSYADAATSPAERGAVIARFATDDHYERVRSAARAVIVVIEEMGGRGDLLVDDSRFLDRAAAVRAGVGWIGRSTMILSPGSGPWQLLGSVATDLEIEPDEPMRRTCGTCEACLPACPTGAIGSEGLDARLCISTWLQAPGPIPYWIRPLVERRIYGCDDCLTSCPPGFGATARSHAGIGEHGFSELLAMSDNELMGRFSWFYVPGREARHLRRNILVAAGNSEEADAVGPILDHFTHKSALVRGHAYWALARSLDVDAWTPLRRRHAFETVPGAIAELERALLMVRAPTGARETVL